jgi:hypothetical protein
MNGEWYHNREKLVFLVERWVKVFQERGAKWGIHPADLVGLIVALVEAKEMLDAVKQGEAAVVLVRKCDEVFLDMKMKAIAIEKQYLFMPPLTPADLAELSPLGEWTIENG